MTKRQFSKTKYKKPIRTLKYTNIVKKKINEKT